MPKKKSPQKFFRREKDRGLENYTEEINGSVVYEKITDEIIKSY